MPKRFDKPIVVEAEQTVDRLDIVAYHVDCDARTIVCDVTARNEQSGTGVIYDRPPLVLTEAQVALAMGEAAIGIAVEAVKMAMGAAPARRLQEAMVANFESSAMLYYNATRDALYARFP